MERKKLIDMFRRMLFIRLFEHEVKRLYRAGEIPGAIHLYIGQEAIAVGICEALRSSDYVTSTHRGHGHFIAKGGVPGKAMAELMGKESGCSKGFGGSMHMFDLGIGFLGGNGIVGGGIPIGAGAAFSAKYRRTDSVAVSFLGEGASNQGTFHETLNIAALWKLPYIAVCENNRYAATTPVEKSTSVEDIAVRAKGYGIPGVIVNGNDCVEVFEVASKAVERARAGEGPTLIECKSYRVEPHCGIIADERPKGEREKWLLPDADPLGIIKNRIGDLGAEEEKRIEEEERERLEKAVDFARESLPMETEKFIEEFVS